MLTNDCISRGKDYNAGGARYNTSYIQGVGIGTITDCLAAIKYNVFDYSRFSMKELMDALINDFEGYGKIHNLVSNRTPKYGNDDGYADSIMEEVFSFYYKSVTGRRNNRGGTYRINMLPTTCHVYFGDVCMAGGKRSGYQWAYGGDQVLLQNGSSQYRRHASQSEIHAFRTGRGRRAESDG